MLGTDRVEAGDPLTDTLAVGDPPQAAKTSTPQSTSEKYLFMIASPGRNMAPVVRPRERAPVCPGHPSSMGTRAEGGDHTTGPDRSRTRVEYQASAWTRNR